jgi:S1-C subfamily serine protease
VNVEALSLVILLSAVPSAANADGLPPDLAKRAADRWAAQFVTVEIWLRRSEGEDPPTMSKWISDEYEEKRPIEIGALAVDPRTIWIPNLDFERRFISRVAVRQEAKGSSRPASLLGAFLVTPGWTVRVEEPLPGVETIEFAPADRPDRLLTVWPYTSGGVPGINVAEADRNFFRVGGLPWINVNKMGVLLVDRDLRAIGYCASGRLGLDGAPDLWKGADVAAGPVLEFAAFERMREGLVAKTAPWVLTVRGFFRREEEEAQGGGFRRFRFRASRQEGEMKNEFLAGGYAVSPRRILVNQRIDQESAMRIERVTVQSSGGEEFPARFVGAFREYRAFLVEVEKDLPAAMDLSSAAPFAISQPVIAVTADFNWGRRREIVDLNRIVNFAKAYKGVLEPSLERFPRPCTLLLGVEDAKLLGAMIEVARESEDDENSRFQMSSGVDLRVVRASELAEIASRTGAAFDPRLAPRPAEREKDMVWLGVDIQPMSHDLARSQGIEIPTRGGEIGLIVLAIHPGSPAAGAGLAPGDILLSMRPDETSEPSEFKSQGDLGREDMFSGMDMIDEDIPDEMMEEYLASAGPPWRSPRNFLNNRMTRIGAGRKVEFAYLREGKEAKTTVTLAAAPPDFETAPKYKAEDLGLTLKDLTYEVRGHYRMKEDAPGVIVAKVEPGSKAAIAKVMPFEVLVSLNGKVVRSVGEVRKAIEEASKAGQGERTLELKLERMGKSRLVRIRP